MKHGSSSFAVTCALVITFLAQLAWPAGRPALLARNNQQPLVPAQTQRVFLPLVASPSALLPPQFTIISPRAGWTIARTLFFAVELQASTVVQQVTFMAGNRTLGTDSSAADGFRVFLNASEFAAGPLVLTASATGTGGTASQTITVTVAPAPAASTTIGTDGAVLATGIGSTITIPPGTMPNGTQVSVVERSQAEVTAQHGFDWDRAGVTFLGAQELTTGVSPSGPLGVASAGFGNRVQPGQAVVNYQLFPDGDGDGTSELVVVNGASVAPNNDVISNPIAPVVLGEPTTPYRTTGMAAQSVPTVLGGPPGTLLEIPATGLNPRAVLSNIAVYHSAVDDTTVELPASVRSEADATQTVITFIPLLPAGPATLTIMNAGTGQVAAPIALVVEAAPPLAQPREQIIDASLVDTVEAVTALHTIATTEGWADVVVATSEAISKTEELRTVLQDMYLDPTSEEVQVLDTMALFFQNAKLPPPSRIAKGTGPSALNCAQDQGTANSVLVALGLAAAVLLAAAGVIIGIAYVVTSAVILVAGALVFGLGTQTAIAAAYGGIALAIACRPDAPPLMCPGTNSLSIESVLLFPPTASTRPKQDGTSPITTGMGSTSVTGGDGCGNALALPPQGGLALLDEGPRGFYDGLAGRIVVRIVSGSGAIPFSGVTDAGGYFYMPLIPAGEPFTAVAYDTLTNRSKTVQGVGPAIGESVPLFFDFVTDAGEATIPLAFGQVVSGAIDAAGDVDVFSFMGTALDWVVVRLLDADVGAMAPLFTLTGPGDRSLCTANAPQLAKNTCRLRDTGLHTIFVSDASGTNTGNYRLYVERPRSLPEPVQLAYGQVVSGTLPLPPALAAFTVATVPNDNVLVRVFDQSAGTPDISFSLVPRDGGSGGCSGGVDSTCEGEPLLLIGSSGAVPDAFRLYVQRTNDPVNATPLVFGETITATIALAPQSGAYTLTGSTGDKVVVTMAKVDGTIINPQLRLFRPDGRQLCSQRALFNQTRVELKCTLDTGSGVRYTLIADDGRITGTGRYTVHLARP